MPLYLTFHKGAVEAQFADNLGGSDVILTESKTPADAIATRVKAGGANYGSDTRVLRLDAPVAHSNVLKQIEKAGWLVVPPGNVAALAEHLKAKGYLVVPPKK